MSGGALTLRPMRSALPILSFALVLSALVTACENAAELIPGDAATPAAEDPNATPAPVIAPPIVPPGSVSLAGAEERDAGAREVIPDARLAQSVVQLQLFDTSTGFVRLVRNGSGVVVDRAQRLILTSYILVAPFRSDGTPTYTSIAIAVNRQTGSEPSLEFEAEIVAAAPSLDLAVLRATRVYRGGPIGPGEFDLPEVNVGDSDALEHGDALRFLGHPGLDATGAPGSQAVASTTATVAGFRGHSAVDGRAWLKTDARLPYGISGGPVFDATGNLVGVATQLQYDPDAVVGQVRPVNLAAELFERARRAGPEARYPAPLQHPGEVPRAPVPAPVGGIVVSPPTFAENAVEGNGLRDLFDYTWLFPTRPSTLYYEYVVQGIPEGALVEERWLLEGVLQDTLSSAFTWSGGPFGIVADRLVTPNERGMPAGRWVLEVWVDGVRHASAIAYVATSLPQEPKIVRFRFGSRAADEQALFPPSSQATQLLAFFDYEHAQGVSQLRWIVFRDGRVVYQSPLVPWEGGDEGTWWIGFASDDPIGAGFWEFEIYLDSPNERQPIRRGADGVELF